MMADLALEFGVQSFVYSSVERGDEKYDDTLTLDRAAKVNIERHIRSLGDKGLNWTSVSHSFTPVNLLMRPPKKVFSVQHSSWKISKDLWVP